MEFKEYNSITNHYQSSYVKRIVNQYPELANAKYVLQEKIDGSNWQIAVNGNEVKFGKRTSFLDENESFFDWQNTVNKPHIKGFIDFLKTKSSELNQTIVVYGEIYGDGVQKRIKYCDGKDIKFYDVEIGGVALSPKETESFFMDNGFESLHVPVFAVVDSLQEALDYNTLIPTALWKGEDPQEIEGVVIKPYNENFYDMGTGSRILIKKKNEKFAEKMRTKFKGDKKVLVGNTAEQDEFNSYITENRFLGIISKHGEMADANQIGKYMKLFLEDAWIDYCKDNELDPETVDGGSKKGIVSQASKPAVTIIKQHC
jgi:Rnl2 family RNA ligase